MKTILENFERAMALFCVERAKQHKRSIAEKRTNEEEKLINDAYFALKKVLKKNDVHFLDDYRNLLAARYDTDARLCYDSGFIDCQRLYWKLYEIKPLCWSDAILSNEESNDNKSLAQKRR